MERIKVLVIEDNPADAHWLWETLIKRRGRELPALSFDVEFVTHLATGLQRLATGDVDVVLLDLLLPDSQGLSTLIRLSQHVPDVPVVVMTELDAAGLDVQ